MSERILDLHEIQGNILGGFNTNIQVLLFFSVPIERMSSAAPFLASLSNEITTVIELCSKSDR